jgi:transposase
MDTVVARTLRPWEGKKLHVMKRQLSNAVNSRHARIILLSRGGVRNVQIAQRCGCSPGWVRQIIHRFNDGGIDAITWYPYYCHRAGPRKFMADVTEQIAEVGLSPPRQLIGMSVWSLPKLRDYLVAQKIVAAISIERLRQILKERRVRWRHTKSWKDGTDPQFWPKYRRIRRLYARRPDGGRRISIDEFGPPAQPAAPSRQALGAHRPRRSSSRHLYPHRRRAAHVRRLRLRT